MNTNFTYVFIMLAWLATIQQVAAQGTAFTYQGQLENGGSAANGIYDLKFTLFNASIGGSAVGNSQTNNSVPVTNGLFVVQIDFGPGIFTGTNYWLEIGVQTNGGSSFITLIPRQRLTPAPYAIFASTASNLLGALPATQLGAGTAAINISGSAASVTGAFAGDVTGIQSATVVGKVDGVTAANVAAGANAANAATSADTANTIVKRDSGGNFSIGGLTLVSNLYLPYPTASAGIIYAGGITLMQAAGENFFAGWNAGNLTMSGNWNTGIGFSALAENTGGYGNTADGFYALFYNTGGYYNTAEGDYALWNNTIGHDNTANGSSALINNITGNYNTADGSLALFGNTNGNNNTASGYQALYDNRNGNNNTASGYQALYYVSTGSGNTGLGQDALPNLQTGSGNIAIGVNAGSAIVAGGNNIDIGNSGFGDESGVIRIGTVGTHTKAVFNGIFGTTVGSGATVQVNANGLLGTVTSSRRFKQNIQNMNDASDVLLALHPVTFQYKPELDPEGNPQFGLIAEDVEKVDPALVLHDDKHQIYTVRYEAVNAMLLNEFLKEHRTVEEQHTEIQDLKQQNNSLAQRLNELETTVKQLAAGK